VQQISVTFEPPQRTTTTEFDDELMSAILWKGVEDGGSGWPDRSHDSAAFDADTGVADHLDAACLQVDRNHRVVRERVGAG
jgi:hypothetical protein